MDRGAAVTAKGSPPLQRRGGHQEKEEQPPAASEPGAGSAQRLADGPREVNRTGIPDALKSAAETLSGLDLSATRVHYDSPRPAQIQAAAFTQRDDIHLGPGQKKHLPHELWQVVQQTLGCVEPTARTEGMAINDDPELEREADRRLPRPAP